MTTYSFNRALLLGVSLVCATPAGPQKSTMLDGIAAVVGDSAILKSELDAYTMLRLEKAGLKADSVNLDSLRRAFLEELVDGKVLVVRAAKDSTIAIKDEEVEDAVGRQIKAIMSENNLSAEQLEQELQKAQGIGVTQFKAQMRKMMREQIVKNKVQQQYISSVPVSKKDVQAFFAQYKDSLPPAGKSVRLAKLTIQVKPSAAVRQAAYAKIRSIKARLDNGENFVAVAKEFSDDPNAASGGDLGFIAKGTLSELAFEEKAFSLKPGEVSDIFETRIGFHIITVEARKDQTVHVRQILAQVTPAAEDIAKVTARLDSVRAHCAAKESFASCVRAYSTDEQSASRGGDMGWVSVDALPQEVRLAVEIVAKGEITAPVHNGNAYAVYRVDDRADNRAYTLENDYDLLAEKARDINVQKRLIELVKKWRDETFVDLRL